MEIRGYGRDNSFLQSTFLVFSYTCKCIWSLTSRAGMGRGILEMRLVLVILYVVRNQFLRSKHYNLCSYQTHEAPHAG